MMQQEYWLALLARRGFAAACAGQRKSVNYIYLPLGTTLRRNVVHEWVYNMVTARENIYLLEGSLVSRSRSSSTSLTNLMLAKDYSKFKEEAEEMRRNHPVFVCQLTQKELKQSSVVPLHFEKDKKFVVEAKDPEQAGQWMKKIKKELAKGARIYRRANKLFLPVKEVTDTHIIFQGAVANEEISVPNYGHTCLESGHPFLAPLTDTTSKKDSTENLEKQPDDDKGEERPGDDKGEDQPGDDKGEERPGDDKVEDQPGDDKGEEQPGDDKGEEQPGDDMGEERPGDDKKEMGTSEDTTLASSEVSMDSTFSPILLQCSSSAGTETSQLRTHLTQDMVNYAGVVMETLNLPLPFGVASVGPVVRDLVGEDTVSSASPPDRLKEFQQMEMLFFCHSSEAHDAYIYWQKQRLRWWKQYSDDPERFSVKETHSDQLPSNELQASVIKFEVPWFSNVVETVKSYQPSSDGTSVIRTASGLDRGFWALLADAHWNRFPEKHNELQVLRLNEMLAPFKVAVIVGNPSNKKQILFGRQLSLELKKTEITTRFSSQGTPEENYIKEDESGTPYCVVVDDTTMSSGVLGFRHRNNGLAEYLHKDDLLHSLYPRLRRYRFFKPT